MEKIVETIIGLEVHVQLSTQSKMFCGCGNDGEKKEPNTTVCEVCTGQPGVLPVPNVQAIEMAVKLGLALGCEMNRVVKFDRKHYYYPDLPKGYQISQYDLPIGEHGRIKLRTSDFEIRIKRIHLEEDAAKLVHNAYGTLVDYNRAGTPLVEIVTEPDFRDARSAKEFMQNLRSIVRYLGVSEGDMEKGHLRCDANISVRYVGETGYNPKVEVKNINSFRNVERALEFERARLTKLLKEGNYPTISGTRGWNEARQMTEEQRSKEAADDYRYMPEPDIPALLLYQKQENAKFQIPNSRNTTGLFDIQALRSELPELPMQKYARFKEEYGFGDAELVLIVDNQNLADYIEQVYSELVAWLGQSDQVEGTAEEIVEQNRAKITKVVSGWILNKLFEALAERGERFEDLKVSPENFAEFLAMIYTGRISSSIGQELLRRMVDTGGDPSNLLEELGGGQISRADELGVVCEKILAQHPDNVASYKKGKVNLIQFFIGQAMKETNGKGNPEALKRLFEEKLR